MTNKAKALSTVLQDALIDISDDDSRESRELLIEAGIDSDTVVQSSILKIEQLKQAFESRLSAKRSESDPFKILSLKVKDFVARSPERASNFLNSYFQERSVPFRFATTTGISKKTFDKVKDKINLEDLSNKLDDEVNR
ncbi:hypothetical protein AAFN85_18385 [Mucilaginibacter sp. CAU 1740]|uniref:hypothetical protein n=1 Tax=Mucilaginibacter sp. CAU 1740 TaxID=3140365 RepID=UPI00325AB98C